MEKEHSIEKHMENKLLFNGEVFHFSKEELPCLITSKEGHGASYFSMRMIVDFLLEGSKIISFTAYSDAMDNFMELTKGHEDKIIIIESKEDIVSAINKSGIIVKSGDTELFKKVIANLDDVDNRVILVKNIEVYDSDIYDSIKNKKNIILSGNLDSCKYKDEIINTNLKTKIVFTSPKANIDIEVPELDKYTGYLSNDGKKGIISLQMPK